MSYEANMDELLTLEEIKAKGIEGYFTAVMKDGSERQATYIADFGGVMFIDRNLDAVAGFRFECRFGERNLKKKTKGGDSA